METVNRDNNKKQQHSGRSQLQFGQAAAQGGRGDPVARPPPEARVPTGPARWRGRQTRAVGVAHGWKC
jgi:hypothetical protein